VQIAQNLISYRLLRVTIRGGPAMINTRRMITCVLLASLFLGNVIIAEEDAE
jgi:hypothetical protein